MALRPEDLKALEEAVERAVRAARGEELREVAEVLKQMAGYIKNIFEALERHEKILQEHTRILQEHSKILERHERILRRHERILREHTKILQEHSKVLQGHTKMLQGHTETLGRHEKLLLELKATLGGLTGRWGIDMERMVLHVYEDVLRDFGISPLKVEKVSIKDVDGRLYRKGAKLEIDVYLHDGRVYFIEVKSLLEADDVEWFEERCAIFEKVLGRRPDRKVVVAVNAMKDAVERAKELGMDVIAGMVLEVE